MTPFRITVATQAGRLSYIALSTSSCQAAIDAVDLVDLTTEACVITVVRA